MIIYTKNLFIFLIAISMGYCQIPSFGGCPVFTPMAQFDKEQFLGTWYEVERYFTVTELASRCVKVTYERRADGRIWVNNAITNRFTGVQRIISGIMQLTGKGDEAKYNVEYTSLPVTYDTTLSVLDTDYKSYAVIWSCNSIGPVGHTQSVWVMTRQRIPPGPIIQRAYGILDKYQISRTFFIKTDQTDCETRVPQQEAYDHERPEEAVPSTSTIDSTDGAKSETVTSTVHTTVAAPTSTTKSVKTNEILKNKTTEIS